METILKYFDIWFGWIIQWLSGAVLSINVLEGRKERWKERARKKGKKRKGRGKGWKEWGKKKRRFSGRYGWASGSQRVVPRPATATSPGTSKKWRFSDLIQMCRISYIQSRDSNWLKCENHWDKQRCGSWYEQVVSIDSGFTRVKKSYQTLMGDKVGSKEPRRLCIIGGKIY